MKRLQSIRNITGALLIGVASLSAYPYSADFYATDSKLSEGKWAKVSVDGTGMFLITDAEIRAMGFSDPSKVNVYGLGGRMLPEALNGVTPDDVPMIPSVRTDKGIVFFGTDHFTWENTISQNTPYSHVIHPYSEDNYYFLSDREAAAYSFETAHSPAQNGAEALTSFTAHLVHERDLANPSETGRVMLGEDFRAKRSQTFDFSLPGNTGAPVQVSVRFASKTTTGNASLMFTANGKTLPSAASDVMAPLSVDQYYRFGNMHKVVENAGNKLTVGMEYSASGVINVARLDYIEVFYDRALSIEGGPLHFYGIYNGGETLEVSGVNDATQLWDVTNPSLPKRVNAERTGSKTRFTVVGAGYREFVAFDPSKVTAKTTTVGGVSNQNLHALETPDMLIISPQEYREGADKIADLHRSYDGMTVHVIDPELIYNEFSGGKPDVTAFRRLLKMWYDRGAGAEQKIRYCLLMGKPSYDNKYVTTDVKNAGYKPLLIWQSPGSLTENTSYSNDDYIGMLEDSGTGSFYPEASKIHVAVGRLPVRNTNESLTVAAKIERHLKRPAYGPWRNKIMVIADDADNGVHLDQAQRCIEHMQNAGNGSSYVYDRLYLDSYKLEMTSVGHTYPAATEHMLRNYNDGVAYTNYIGHASPAGWGHEHLWVWNDIINMSNPNLTFIYAATCGFAFWDKPSISGGEHLVLNPDGGVVGMMAATRSVYISNNGVLNELTSKHITEYDSDGLPLRLGDAYIRGKNDYNQIDSDTNKLRYAFLGDPALRLNHGGYQVAITHIDGRDISSANSEMPTIPALGVVEVSGEIRRPNGAAAADFNGVVCLELYDAETVIETFGNGSNGAKRIYNDRKTRLAMVSAPVSEGKWKARLSLPLEIENNYSPARIVAYAYDAAGAEANGATEHLYVYGAPKQTVTDTDGPAVEKLYLNHEGFVSGGSVSGNSILYARVSDPSGINLSDAGIGHKMTIAIDGKDYLTDVDVYYTPDPEDQCAGSVTYPLQGIDPGKHELTFTVWDNANNSTRSSIEFTVAAAVDPKIVTLGTNVNPATTSVTFRFGIDRPQTRVTYTLGVYDLSGRCVWETSRTTSTDRESIITADWNLCDGSGTRVPRGIYLYRVTVETPEGTFASETRKLAVTAQ